MKRINENSLNEFIKECQSYYADKKLETILMYELNKNKEEIMIGDRIHISEKAVKQSSDSVSLDIRYFWFVCAKLKENGKGILMIHNHGNQAKPSPKDENSYQEIKKMINYCGIDTFMFCVYSPSEFHYRISGDLYDESTFNI